MVTATVVYLQAKITITYNYRVRLGMIQEWSLRNMKLGTWKLKIEEHGEWKHKTINSFTISTGSDGPRGCSLESRPRTARVTSGHHTYLESFQSLPEKLLPHCRVPNIRFSHRPSPSIDPMYWTFLLVVHRETVLV